MNELKTYNIILKDTKEERVVFARSLYEVYLIMEAKGQADNFYFDLLKGGN